jgi:DNA replication protein DnaC
MAETCWLYDKCNHRDCDKDFCLRKYKLDYLYSNSLLSNTQRKPFTLFVDQDGTDLAEFQQLAEIQKNIEEFVATGKNLYLHSSNCGVGKTSWAIKLMQAYFDKIWAKTPLMCRALFVNVPRFLLAIKDSISNKNEYADFIRENIMNADLVVWDDISAKMGSDYEINYLLSLIDGRIALGKSNIYTSNANRQEIYTSLGNRLASRICQFSTDIEFHGEDKRGFGGQN